MQTMPNKTRTALAIGAVLLAVVVGAYALWSGNGNEAAKAPETAADTQAETDDLAANLNGTTDAATTDSTTEAAAEDEEAQPVSGTTIAPATAQVPETHTVQTGETLRDIAKKYYNNPDYSGYIEAFNELENPNNIKAGDTIKLPRPEEITKDAQQN